MHDLLVFIGIASLPVGAGLGVALIRMSGVMKDGLRPKDPTARALGILQERYAKGEIDLDEYLQRRGYLELEAPR